LRVPCRSTGLSSAELLAVEGVAPVTHTLTRSTALRDATDLHRSHRRDERMAMTLSTGTLTDVLITDELMRRPPRRADHEAENRALRQLARNMAGRPDALLQKLVHIALELCRAGTAGVSLLQKNADGQQMFVWVALAGTYSGHVGKRTPARFSVCGICLERQAAQLYSHPDRYFSYYASQEDFEAGDSAQPFEDPGIVETLVVPFPAGSRPMGT